MSAAAEYRAYGQKLMELALRTDNVIERGHLISFAAEWHMRAAELEHGPLPGLGWLDDDMDAPPPAAEAAAPGV